MSGTTHKPAGDENLAKNLAITFAFALLCYVAAFSWLQHRRVFKGPWEIEFAADAAGQPSLQISQRTLGLSGKLVFPGTNVGRTNFSQRVKFSELTTNLPFGQFVFQDPLYLPGTVTMRVCGHEIEVMPRTLRVDQTEHPWPSVGEIVVPRPPDKTPASR